ncbi:MAG: helix-turn-helix transcriptional regulator [Porticoccaceae bacterium]
MNSRDRAILLTTLLLITVMVTFDLITDSGEGVALWHLLAEGTAGLLALCGTFYILRDTFRLKKNLRNERHISAVLKKESEEWRNRSRTYLDGLSEAIDRQLSIWNLTPAEKEVAFLLLKGMSLKEIAGIRGTAEKTARVQSMSIYSKSGLAGRSELAAFFLEDLLPAEGARENRE